MIANSIYMKKISFWLLIIILFLTLQRIFADYLAISGATPDLVLIATVYFALRYGPGWGQSLGFMSGIFQDVFAIYLFGANALIKTIIGFSVGQLKKKFDCSNRATQIIIIFCATIGNFVFYYLVEIIFLSYPVPFRGMTFLVFILYNTILTPFIFMLLQKIESIFQKKATRSEDKTYSLP